VGTEFADGVPCFFKFVDGVVRNHCVVLFVISGLGSEHCATGGLQDTE
jgi:hypothetical protein